MKIFHNKSAWTASDKMLFGIAQLLDALVRVLSFGMLCTDFPLVASRKATENVFKRIKKQRGETT